MSTEEIKEVVKRFNQEVIVEGSESSFHQLMNDRFVNHSAPPGLPNGPEGMWNTFENILRPALSELNVEIHQQVAEGDWVTTRKTITGRHTGTLLGIAPTNKNVAIDVIDMVRVCDGQYVDHWGINTLASVLAQLKKD